MVEKNILELTGPAFFQNATNTDLFYTFIKTQKLVSFYVNGKKYFLFAFKGKIFTLSEFQLTFVICFITASSVIALRKLAKRYQLKKKLRHYLNKTIKQLRSGEIPVTELVNEDEILHYEDKVTTIANYHPISWSDSNLSTRQRWIKSIVKKCIKPGTMYKITNRGLLEILDKIAGYKKGDDVRVISYDVFVLAGAIGLRLTSFLVFEGAVAFMLDGSIQVLKKLGYSTAIANFPLLIGFFVSFVGACFVNLRQGPISIGLSVIRVIWLGLVGSQFGEFLRMQYLIDCSDYVRELPQKHVFELPAGDSQTVEEFTNGLSNSKISYTKEIPTRHDTFLATQPDQQLYYENGVENHPIKTLDGTLKTAQKVNGEKSLIWKADREVQSSIKSTYVPLKDRTKTLADLQLDNLDSSEILKQTQAITQTIQEEQIKVKLAELAANGE